MVMIMIKLKKKEIPVGYKPYEYINVASIETDHVLFLFSVEKKLPLIIGKGSVPQVWIRTQISGWEDIISSSNINYESISGYKLEIQKDIFKRRVRIHAKSSDEGVLVLDVRQSSKDRLVIDHIDLRPLGLKIFTDDDSLTVNFVTLSNLKFLHMKYIVEV